MVDYAAVLADLRQKRDQLADLITRIEAFAPPAAPAPNGDHPAIDPRKIPRRPSKRKAAPKPHAAAPKGDAKAKAIALRKANPEMAADTIATKVGAHFTTVYRWLAQAGLGNKKGAKDSKDSTTTAAGAGALRRLCGECGQKGISDPCEHCGEAR